MKRATKTYTLRLSKDEKENLSKIAEQMGLTCAQVIRQSISGLTKRAADKCPRCAGKGKVLDGLVTGKCLQCNGTGIRR